MKQYTGERVDAPLSLTVYPGTPGSFLLYEDDGQTFNHRKGEWMGLAISWNDRDRLLALQLAPGSRMVPPARRNLEVRIAPDGPPRAVVFEGRTVEVRF